MNRTEARQRLVYADDLLRSAWPPELVGAVSHLKDVLNYVLDQMDENHPEPSRPNSIRILPPTVILDGQPEGKP